jgi:hypothetical protein
MGLLKKPFSMKAFSINIPSLEGRGVAFSTAPRYPIGI